MEIEPEAHSMSWGYSIRGNISTKVYKIKFYEAKADYPDSPFSEVVLAEPAFLKFFSDLEKVKGNAEKSE